MLPLTIVLFAVNILIILRIIKANSPVFLRTLFFGISYNGLGLKAGGQLELLHCQPLQK